jgi:hypothetical protein
MAYVAMTCELDSADLRLLQTEIFPQLLAAGRRTIEEQCVTSATFIAARAQQGMTFVAVGTIDRELEVEMIPRIGVRGKPLKNKRDVAVQSGVRVPLGVLIVMARGNPFSKYSQETGDRWPLTLPSGGPGYKERLAEFVQASLQRMVMARHSSTHFLLTGWTPAIRDGLASDKYRYNASFGSRKDASAVGNAGTDGFKKVGSVRGLGKMTIELSGDDCVVTASNDVGGAGNDVLAKKYREALIEHGMGPLEDAIAREVADGEKELEIRFLMKTTGLSRPMVNFTYFPK